MKPDDPRRPYRPPRKAPRPVFDREMTRAFRLAMRHADAANFDAVCADPRKAPRTPPPMPKQPRVRSAGEIALAADRRAGLVP